MRTANRSFQLEETVPGIFLLQGWFGGILAAFVYVVALVIWDESFKFHETFAVGAYLAFFTGILGIIKATIMWTICRLTKVQPRAATRVIVASLATGLLAFTTGYLLGTGRPNDMAAWMVTLLLGGLPTAILIGSSVKPWELFTFGSITTGEGKAGSRSVLATLGTLPLRFLSLFALAAWLLYFACEVRNMMWFSDAMLSLLIPAAYLLFSAYVTFRSPHKVILFIIGLGLNIPLVLIAFLLSSSYQETGWFREDLRYLSVICAAFAGAWLVFLIARLSARTNIVATPLSILRKDLLAGRLQQDHHCLGSRFLEWQQRHA